MLMPSEGKVVYDITGDNSQFKKSTEESKSIAQKAFETIKNVGTTAMNAVAVAAGAIGAAASAAAIGVGKMVVGAGAAADDLNTLATVSGISTEELQKFEYASGLIDVSVDTLTGSLSKLTKNMDSARKGTGDAADVFAELGISIVDANGELRDNEDVFADAIAALGKIENATERDAKAMALFGRSAQELNPLIEGGADRLKELGDQADDAGLILSQGMLDKLNSVNDAMDTFKATTEGAGRLFSTAFAEPIAEGMNKVNGWYQDLTAAFASGGFDGLMEQVQVIIPQAFQYLGEILPKILDFGVEIVMTLVNAIIDSLPELTTVIVDMLVHIVETLTSPASISMIANSAVQIFITLVDAFVASFPLIVTAAIDLIATLATTLLSPDNLSHIIESGLELLLAVVNAIVDNIPLLIDAALAIIMGLVDFITDPKNLSTIIDATITLIMTLINGIVQNLPRLWEAEIAIINALVTGLLDPKMLSMLLNCAMNLIFQLGQGLIKNIPILIESMTTLLFTLIKTIIKWVTSGDFLKTLWEVGKGIMNGFVEGIKNSITAVIEKVKEAVNKVVGAVKNFLGIHSPSKVFEVIGKFSDEGLAEGVKKWAGLPEEAMVDVAAGMVKGISGLPSLASDYSFMANPTPAFAVNNQMTGVVEMDGFTVGTIVLRNMDDAAAFTVRGV